MGGGERDFETIVALVCDAVGDLTGRQLTRDDLARSFEELELDSLVLVDVICEIEDHVGAELDDEVLARMMDCGSLTEVIALYTSSHAG